MSFFECERAATEAPVVGDTGPGAARAVDAECVKRRQHPVLIEDHDRHVTEVCVDHRPAAEQRVRRGERCPVDLHREQALQCRKTAGDLEVGWIDRAVLIERADERSRRLALEPASRLAISGPLRAGPLRPLLQNSQFWFALTAFAPRTRILGSRKRHREP